MGRGEQVTKVFEYFDELREQAPNKIFTLFGNHEWMNLLGMLLSSLLVYVNNNCR